MHAQTIRDWWLEHRTKLLRCALILMAVIAIMRLGYEFWRLIFDVCPPGANDLYTLYTLTHEWFSGRALVSMYPPASYPLLWLFYGWLSLGAARWVWALTSIALLAGFAILLIRVTKTDIRLERFFVVSFLLAIYPTAITIGNGQLTLHVIFPLLISILIVKERKGRWELDFLASLLLLLALVKPSITIPFLWIILFVSGSRRVLTILSLSYAALTLFSVSFRENAFLGFLRDMKFYESGIFTQRGYANLHAWLGALDLEPWAFPATFVVLLALGLWCYRHRHSDIWLQLGVAALVARFWVYHRLYDDFLIIFPMIALFRLAKQAPSADNRDIAAGVLLFFSWAFLLIPGTLYRLPPPLGVPFRISQALIWILLLVFLLRQAERSRKLKLSLLTMSLRNDKS